VYVVEFHSDVNMREARALVAEHDLHWIENPDAGAHRLLVSGLFGSLSRLASWDEVAYTFPASPELIAHVPVRACAGAVLHNRLPVFLPGLFLARYPWLTLGYVFSRLTKRISAGFHPVGNVARVQRVGEGGKREIHGGNRCPNDAAHECLVRRGCARRSVSIRRAERSARAYLLSRSA